MIQHFRGPQVEFPLSSTSRTVSRLLAEMIKTHRIIKLGLDHNPKFSLGPHKIISAHNQQEVAWKKWIMNFFLCLVYWL